MTLLLDCLLAYCASAAFATCLLKACAAMKTLEKRGREETRGIRVLKIAMNSMMRTIAKSFSRLRCNVS